MIQNLFPIPVGDYTLDRELSAEEISFIKQQETYDNEGNLTSQNHKMLECESLKGLRSFIVDRLNDYFRQVHNPKNDVRLSITQSWCNYTAPGQYHHKHAHPNSFISGVFYPQADIERDRIFFYRDIYKVIEIPSKEYTSWNSDSWWFEAGTGRLFIFPSSLTHAVPRTESDETRISLSFNTFPVGNLGTDRQLTGLNVDKVY